jgi:predicted TIM-barrel fold metal-dependent hydrolase
MSIIDAHAHAFPDAIAPHALKVLIAEALWRPVQAYHDGTVAGLVASMDRAGIEQTVLCSVATKPAQVRKITDWSAAVATERIIPFASIHPNFAEPEKQVERIAAMGLRGLKFHPQYMSCAPDDPRAIRIARAAAKRGLAMVLHAGHDIAYPKTDIATPSRVRRLHDTVPDLRLLACHLGGFDEWEESIRHLVGTDVYLDTSFSFGHVPADVLRRIIEGHTPTRLVFGSDSPWADPAVDLEAFDRLPLPDDRKRMALWDNAMAFVGLA